MFDTLRKDCVGVFGQIGWGSTPIVVTDRRWFNARLDGSGMFLYDRQVAAPFGRNVADDNRAVVDALCQLARPMRAGIFQSGC